LGNCSLPADVPPSHHTVCTVEASALAGTYFLSTTVLYFSAR
jgi:predicted hydrocarbon binding protein